MVAVINGAGSQQYEGVTREIAGDQGQPLQVYDASYNPNYVVTYLRDLWFTTDTGPQYVPPIDWCHLLQCGTVTPIPPPTLGGTGPDCPVPEPTTLHVMLICAVLVFACWRWTVRVTR
jgi:hypothetical protein